MFFYGAHIKKKKTIIATLQEVHKYGGNFLQIFVSNPMSGRHKKEMMDKYREMGTEIKQYLLDNNMKLVIHSPYTLNFGRRVVTPEDAYWVRSYYEELLIGHYLGAMGCVIHVGKNESKEGIEYMFISLRYLIQRVLKEHLDIKIILETAAGQGNELLVDYRDLLTFYQRFSDREKDVLKICLDTAHLHAAGFKLDNIDRLIKAFDGNVVLIHLNDSKVAFNSRVDRHECIGKGTIGQGTLTSVLKTAIQYDIPIILETPNDGYKKEIKWITKVFQ
jgi:apurinic endonuclease APN1